MPNEVAVAILTAIVVIACSAGAYIVYVKTREIRRASPDPTHHPHASFAAMAKWYSGKQCGICGREIPPLGHFGPQPGLMRAGSSPPVTLAWIDIPAEQLPPMLETHVAVCASCHLMTWFQHEHAELIVDRHRVQETVLH